MRWEEKTPGGHGREGHPEDKGHSPGVPLRPAGRGRQVESDSWAGGPSLGQNGSCVRTGAALPWPPLLSHRPPPAPSGPASQGLDPRPRLSAGHLMAMTDPQRVLPAPLGSSRPNLRPSPHSLRSAPTWGQGDREDSGKKKLTGWKCSRRGAPESRWRRSERSPCPFSTLSVLFFLFI